MRKLRGKVRLVMLAGLMMALSACAASFRTHGYAPTEEELAAIIVGKDTRESVAQAIGRPSTTGLVSDRNWYYVQSRFRQFAWQAPQEVDREVLVIRFNAAGKVANIERFGLEDGRLIVLSRRITPSAVNDAPLLRQMLGDIGRAIGGGLF